MRQRLFYQILIISAYISSIGFGIFYSLTDSDPRLVVLTITVFIFYLFSALVTFFIPRVIHIFRISIFFALVAFILQIIWTGGFYSPSIFQLMIIPILAFFYKPVQDRYYFFVLTFFSVIAIIFLTAKGLFVSDGVPQQYQFQYSVIVFFYVAAIFFTFIFMFRFAVTGTNRRLSRSLKDLKETTQKLIDSEKMASLGQLMAGIAHEINNPINYVKGSSDQLQLIFADLFRLEKERMAADERVLKISDPIEFQKQYQNESRRLNDLRESIQFESIWNDSQDLIESIKIGSSKTAEIIGSLKYYSRKNESFDDLFDINTTIETTLRILNHRIGEEVQVKKQLQNNIPKIEGNEGRLGQVMMNLMMNALQAIGEKGTINIFTKFVTSANAILISIRDTGNGIAKEHQNKIFDPFFTTKDVGQGTGLGLAITKKIIEEHNGTISFESSPIGTIFTLFLPLSESGTSSINFELELDSPTISQ